MIEITPAMKLLTVGGVMNLAFGFLLGHYLGMFRLKNPDTPYRYLLVAHKAGLQQSFMLFGLCFAVVFSTLSDQTEYYAAVALVFSTVLLNIGEMVNWYFRLEDEFKSRSIGMIIKTISAVFSTVGLAVLVYGVIKAI
ncbi:MAG: hypothetical protein U9N31_09690 [Candidatus Marinimicrobia bacterium]|nr:hypothetical protein [Candidatus Neomarinimicrobiota bacterium]